MFILKTPNISFFFLFLIMAPKAPPIRLCLHLHAQLSHPPHTPSVHSAPATLASSFSANMPRWILPQGLELCWPLGLKHLSLKLSQDQLELIIFSPFSLLFIATMLFLHFLYFIMSLFSPSC